MRSKLVLQAYLCFIGVLTALITYQLGINTVNSFSIDLLFFIGLLLANNRRSIETESGAFSLNYPFLLPVMALYGPLAAALVAVIGIMELEEFKQPLAVIIHNRGTIAFSALMGGIAYHSIFTHYGFTLAVTGSALAYLLANTLFFAVAKLVEMLTLDTRDGFLNDLLEILKTLLPSAALGAVFYYTYVYFSVYGLIVSYLFFLALRSQTLFGLLDTTYRLALIKSLLRAVWAKDPELMQHMERVAFFSRELARQYGYSPLKQRALDEACYFHDIGKLEIQDDILKRPGRLTQRQFETIKSHPERGARFIEEIPIPLRNRKTIRNIVLYHHERWDGAGYPYGMEGEQIPLEARIVAVADTWDAMTSHRCYKEALSIPDAITELKRVRGTQLDPAVVDVFLTILDDVLDKERKQASASLMDEKHSFPASW
ncbi:MAG: HD-GYP domain-containing protein [Firmicutes bacterium]|jgi:putative nucleotidyltransferase with HDIG domain|nr:HD-GYP domain-containing protein [Bacillota bacterium]